MIINSRFRDYYDSSNNGWIDKTVVYNRKEEDIVDELLARKLKEEFSYMHLNTRYDKKSRLYHNFYIIGFCGKLYPLVNYKIENVLEEVNL